MTQTPRRNCRLRNHWLLAVLLLLISSALVVGQPRNRRLQYPTSGDPVSRILLLPILRAEDERRWDNDLRSLFSARNANVRQRAALAAGRIGDERAVPDLISLMQKDDEPAVRAMAAFALGEIESVEAVDALVLAADESTSSELRARAVEALGKIGAALPKEEEGLARELARAVLSTLQVKDDQPAPDLREILLGLTAVLRTKPDNGGPTVAKFLNHPEARVREDAANTLARLKLKDGNEKLHDLIFHDPSPIARANAARVLGETEDKSAFEMLLTAAANDRDSRVRVSAIRSLALLKDARATERLLGRGRNLLAESPLGPATRNELLELATALGRLNQLNGNPAVRAWLSELSQKLGHSAPEVEIARARVSPRDYVAESSTGKRAVETLFTNWNAASSLAQALGELATLQQMSDRRGADAPHADDLLRAMLDYRNSGININTLVAVHSEYAIPDVLRAYAAHKPKNLDDVLRSHLKESDVIIRATAAELLGDLPPSETNRNALIAALPVALADRQLNDAALSILDSLAKQKHAAANDAIKSALDSKDHLVRRRAVALLKGNGAGDFSSRIGTVQTRNTLADYERAIARIGKPVNALVTTSSGTFTIQLLPEEAPLNVDNFIQLAKQHYFNGIKIHRVVPNFVIQDGDPRGDGNGGPGYQIRCEINEVSYDRGAVGMALSGKDTGGSQWFVTHSPQPHLDGGYTVFGNVTRGMDVVDRIARGDVIQSITISERGARVRGGRR